jgi:hypothetical protein
MIWVLTSSLIGDLHSMTPHNVGIILTHCIKKSQTVLLRTS